MKLITQTKLTLNFIYYMFYVWYCLLVAIFGYILKPFELDPALWDLLWIGKQGIQTIVILYVLASVPGALYGFKKKMASVSKIENETLRAQTYTNWAAMRMMLIGLGGVFGIVAFYMLNDQSMLWCAGISILALFFCKPTEKKIFMEMNDIREDDPRMGDFM